MRFERLSFQKLKDSGRNITYSGDADRDGVPNALDCEPLNPDKQGWIHDRFAEAKEAVKEKYGKYKEERKEAKEHETKVKNVQKEAYREERIKQASNVGREKARYESKKRIETIRKPQSQGSFLDTASHNVRSAVGQRRKQKQKVRYQVIGGKAYPVASKKASKGRFVRQEERRPAMFGSGGGIAASDMYLGGGGHSSRKSSGGGLPLASQMFMGGGKKGKRRDNFNLW